MTTTQHQGTATTQPAGTAPAASAVPPPDRKIGMENLVEILGKGGAKDEYIETLLTQQQRWDMDDVLLLFHTLRGKKAPSTPPTSPNAKPEGAKAH